MPDKASLLARVKQLLALAKSANVHEAAAAAAKAQELIARYQLDDCLDDSNGGSPGNGPGNGPIIHQTLWVCETKNKPVWIGMLAIAIGQANGTRFYWDWDRRHEPVTGLTYHRPCLKAIGTASDIDISGVLIQYLSGECNRLLGVISRLVRADRAYQNSFRIGFVQEIDKKLASARQAAIAKLKTEATTPGEQAYAIMRVDTALARWRERDAKLNDAMKDAGVRYSRQRSGVSSEQGLEHGRHAGRHTDVNAKPTRGMIGES